VDLHRRIIDFAFETATGKLDIGQPDMFDIIAFNEGFLDLKVGLAGGRVLERCGSGRRVC
jgi:hypothetical protein